jgi:hypothetical protein
MTKYWPNTQITYRTTVKNNGVLAGPTTITFQYKIGRWGTWTSVTPATISTGIYTASVTPTYGGPLYWQWRTTGPAVQEEGMTLIECSEFDTTGYGYNYDYGFGSYYYGY